MNAILRGDETVLFVKTNPGAGAGKYKPTGAGYTVVVTSSGEEALRIIQGTAGKAIDLLALFRPIQEEAKQMNVCMMPLCHVAQPEDIAGAIYLLALDEAQFITGSYTSASGLGYWPEEIVVAIQSEANIAPPVTSTRTRSSRARTRSGGTLFRACHIAGGALHGVVVMVR